MRKAWMFGLVILGAVMMASGMPSSANEGGGGGGGGSQKHTIFFGKITAVDPANAAITIAGKDGASQSFTIPVGTQINVNGKAGTLADITLEMQGGVKLENGTPIMVKAWHPGKHDKPKQ